MNSLKPLSDKELRTIEGGDWIKSLGERVHKAWCSFTSGVARGYRNYMSSGSDTPAGG